MNRLCSALLLLLCSVLPGLPAVAAETAAAGAVAPAPPPAEVAPQPADVPRAAKGKVRPQQDSYSIEPLGGSVYAAIAKIGGQASSNAMFVIGQEYVVAVGAHMTKELIADLYAEIAFLTSKPIRYFVLAHHHSGYSHIDFDFPPGQDVIMAWQAWQDMNSAIRKPEYPVLFFNEGLTIKTGGATVVLTNVGRGHSAGDIVALIPELGVVFASDLLYVNSVGYMGGGYMREWLLALDFLEELGAEKIIPGTGPVCTVEEVRDFKEFFRAFLSDVLMRVELGQSLQQVLDEFDLPEYRHMYGYEQLIKANLERAYTELKDEFGR
jgi:glyoxylase-like metal-dependent hydrolase (beta-lactamase superfamily II)